MAWHCLRGRDPCEPQKFAFFERLYIINIKWKSFFCFVLYFLLPAVAGPFPGTNAKKMTAKSRKKHANRAKFFVQFKCQSEFYNILCRPSWLYSYTYKICSRLLSNRLRVVMDEQLEVFQLKVFQLARSIRCRARASCRLQRNTWNY